MALAITVVNAAIVLIFAAVAGVSTLPSIAVVAVVVAPTGPLPIVLLVVSPLPLPLILVVVMAPGTFVGTGDDDLVVVSPGTVGCVGGKPADVMTCGEQYVSG